MKKIRILSIVLLVVAIVCCFAGCKKKELAPVYTKVSDNEISFLTQQSQYVIAKVTVIDGENEMTFETVVTLESDEVLSIGLKDITDKTFFTQDAEIKNVEVVKQEMKIDTPLLMIISIGAAMLASALVIISIDIIGKKRRKIK